ncbi:hypothetical protein B0T26DRAFT_670881 [Lasiosphaeria miniovina]|uniref:Zn(2)-C6 fungal-type domain-containing protein n=1 Tax=Lasiosphaeria miniovina TaxID=1954250 RepID=A0AA40BI22_9PEZI|nr:uncharacterized protein B0T26DRAFT_670881 [Lasiosphaeria miniovina]KAK0734606.1 hypothetical protein B0T26DRAFT_670881 [Lasiosphaeria miniovina]
MARPKVPDDKRRRTAQACTFCKRRKLKCNGQKPCQACTKKSLTCLYTLNLGDSPMSPPTAQMTQMTQITQTVHTTQPVQSPSNNRQAPKPPIHSPRSQPPLASPNGQIEEINTCTDTRILEDQTRRLLYIGDTSTLSILQLIRIIVEETAGADITSPFVHDPNRHRIIEHTIDFPANTNVLGLLPKRQTADILIDSYFTNFLLWVCFLRPQFPIAQRKP